MSKIYRNVYFKKNILQSGNGNIDVLYNGHLYSNAESIKNFKQMYDKSVDLYVPCTECAFNKYHNFIKVE